MPDPIAEARIQAKSSWYRDGLSDILIGITMLLQNGFTLVMHFSNRQSSWYRPLILIYLLVFRVLAVRAPRIMAAMRERITYPRNRGLDNPSHVRLVTGYSSRTLGSGSLNSGDASRRRFFFGRAHELARLMIAATLYLAKEADFLYLQGQTDLTKGNLSSHLAKLEEAGYVKIEKTYRGKIPMTVCRLTKKGRASFKAYEAALLFISQRRNRLGARD